MSTSRTVRRLALGGVTVAALAGLTACGSSDSGTHSPPKAAASAKSAAEKKKHAKYQVKATGMDVATFAGEPTADEVSIGNVDTNKWEKGTYSDKWEWKDQYDDAFTLTKLGTPDHGTVTHKGNTITYTPNAGFMGDDTFTYTVKWHGQTSTGTVTVDVMDEHNDYTPSDSGSSSSGGSSGGHVHACVGSKHFKMCT
jgi:hypothetical protein